jgi:hypothetical protein
MSDTAAATAAATDSAVTVETPSAEDKGGKPDYTPPATQADLDKVIESRLARERDKYKDYDELKAKAEQLANADKSDLELAQQRAEQAEAKAAEVELRAIRAEVAATKNVPADLLTGSTKEEIEAAADRLIEFRGAKTPVGVHLPNQDKSPQKQASAIGETARKLFGGQ